MPCTKLLMALPLAALSVALMVQAPARAQEGMVVVRDPLTGELRAPTPAERKALNAAPKAALRAGAPAAPQAIVNPDGSRKVRLGERGQVYEVVRRGPDGKLIEQCLQGEDAASRALAKPGEAGHEDR